MTLSVEDWLAWAESNDIDGNVQAFIKYRPEALHKFDPRSTEMAFPCPRTWHYASDLLSSIKQTKQNIEASMLSEMLGGVVGKGFGAEFAGFLQIVDTLVSVETIILDPQTAPVPTEPSVTYALALALAAHADRKNLGALFTYARRMPEEMLFLFARKLEKEQAVLRKSKEFVQFIADYQHYL